MSGSGGEENKTKTEVAETDYSVIIAYTLLVIGLIYNLCMLSKITGRTVLVAPMVNVVYSFLDSTYVRIPFVYKADGSIMGQDWRIPDSTFRDLIHVASGAPINQKTGKKYLHVSIVNQESLVIVTLDEYSYETMTAAGAQAVYFPSNFTTRAVNNRKMVEYCRILKVKPTIIWQLLLWDMEVVLIDSDVAFLETPLVDVFNGESDFEVQCDSRDFVYIPSNRSRVVWEVNSGFFKIRPTPAVMAFMPLWAKCMYSVAKVHDQGALKKVLGNFARSWVNEDTMKIHTGHMLGIGEDLSGLTMRYLDPMLICNAGGLYMSGRKLWKEEARRRGVKRPKVIHYFHCGKISQKRKLMQNNDMWFVTSDNKCIATPTKGSVEWPLWNK